MRAAWALVAGPLLTVVFGILLAGVVMAAPVPVVDEVEVALNNPVQVTGKAPAQELLDEHHCWTGKPPKDMRGVLPEHAVVTVPGRDEPAYVGQELTGRALDQVAGDADHGLAVWGFCR